MYKTVLEFPAVIAVNHYWHSKLAKIYKHFPLGCTCRATYDTTTDMVSVSALA